MSLTNPFPNTPTPRLGRWALIFTGMAVVLGAVVFAVAEAGPGMKELGALVLAGSPGQAGEVVAGWSADERYLIAYVAGFDLVGFGVAWTTAMALGCFWAARQWRRERWRLTGIVLGWLSWVALLFDIPENTAYLLMTMGYTNSPWPQMALVATTPRWLIVAGGLVFIGISFAATRTTGSPASQPSSAD